MKNYEKKDPEPLKAEFVETFNAVCRWYTSPLCVEANGKTPFHEWIATIQMVSTTRMLQAIRDGRTTEEKVRAVIDQYWAGFSAGVEDEKTGELKGGVLQEKQNTTTHWAKQNDWIAKLEKECLVPVAA